MRTSTTPAVFLGHGSPMNTLEHNGFTEAWADVGAAVPRPRAVVAVSAHWYTGETAVTAMAQPRTIHDFAGFPPELSTFQYPAPGSPEVAAEVAALLAPCEVRADLGDWGLDHGTWSVLAHVYPDADVPVVQLSIDGRRPVEWHLEVGQRLAALRNSGVLLLGSGNVVHNLGRMDWGRPDAGDDWAVQFDEHVLDVLTTDPRRITEVHRHPAYRAAVPTPEHFLPVVHLAGMAVAAGVTLTPFAKGHAYGSLSMTSYRLD
ncbi:MAG: 4,5-DOPA dioxygenase extradiol [Actinomycetes bacterium]